MRLRVTTPDGVKFDRDVQLAEVKTSEGYMGILVNHVPTVATIQISTMYVKENDGTRRAAAIGGGLLSTTKDTIDVISESFDFVEDIDRGQTAMLLAEYEKIKQIDPNNRKNNLMLEIAVNRIKSARK